MGNQPEVVTDQPVPRLQIPRPKGLKRLDLLPWRERLGKAAPLQMKRQIQDMPGHKAQKYTKHQTPLPAISIRQEGLVSCTGPVSLRLFGENFTLRSKSFCENTI